MDSAELTWVPPVYDVSRDPQLAHTGTLAPSVSSGNFARHARWCPDGSVALAQCEDASFQYLDLPPDLLGTPPDITPPKTTHLPQPAPILDFAWYPFATPRDPASFCFVASVRDTPIKLLDASTGRLRASYKLVDHRERHIAPHSLAFNLQATKLYAGFEDAIEIFDVLTPGAGTRLPTTPSKKSRDGLKGIVSALAFAPDASGVFAAGTLGAAHVALFSEVSGTPVMYCGGGGRGGASQVRFNPLRPHILYASFRRCGTVYAWDLRGDVGQPLQTFGGDVGGETNQRLRFDVDVMGSVLGVGDHRGGVSFFDLNNPEAQVELNGTEEQTTVHSEPKLRLQAHDDAVGSVSFHPLQPLVLSVSGSRHYPASSTDTSSSEEDSEDETGDTASTTNRVVKRQRQRPAPAVKDASFKLWDFRAPRAD